MRRKNKKRSMLLVLLMLIAGISMGYAILNTTLNINGTSKIKDAKWNIYWDNPQVTTGSVTDTAPTIDSLKTTATFDITLNNPGDYYEFTIDAKNAGTIDGMISTISYKLNDTEIDLENPLPAYLNYTVTYSDDVELETNHLLAANTKETYKVRVEFKKNIENNQLPGQEVTLSLKFAVTYIQANNNASAVHPSAITYITRQNEGQITPGDVIGIGETEDFYVISSNAEKTVLLAKYNLLVGSIYSSPNREYIGFVHTTDQGYGLQSIDAIAPYDGEIVGGYSIAFTSTNYWDDGDDENHNLISPYNANGASYDGNPYPYVYNNTYITAPDFSTECDYSTNCYETPGYSIAYYVEEYKDRLIGMGAPSAITGRLLSYEEAVATQSVKDNNTSIVFNKQSYWLGTVAFGDFPFVIQTSYSGDYDSISNCYYSADNYAGVRPVIEIPTSELQ